jgi:hypothetical protein
MRSTCSRKKTRAPVSATVQTLNLLFLLLVLFSGTARGSDSLDFKHSFRPALLTAHGNWTGAISYDLGVSTVLVSRVEKESFRKSLTAHAATRGTVAINPDINTEPLNADAGITTSINFYQPPIIVPGEKPGELVTKEEGFNYGRLSFSLLGGYETDQKLDNRNVTAGAELGYALTETQGFKSLVPSVFVGYDFLFVDHSELQKSLGLDDSDSRRLRVFASWKFPVGQWLPPVLEPLTAHFDLRYYLSDGLPSVYRATDRDDAIYAAGSLSYSFSREPLWGFVNALFVRVATGRIPPETKDATTVMVGLAVWER